MPYAKGVIANWFSYYVRDDGMIWHKAAELPASARTLTKLALYHSYSGDDGSFALSYFLKAKALADILIGRHAASLQYSPADPRFGIPVGGDDALHPETPLTALQGHSAFPLHWYSSAAELYRAAQEIGKV